MTSELEQLHADRLPYDRPVLAVIPLAPGQVLGVGCKVAYPPGGVVPTGTYPLLGCLANRCKTSVGS
jgi:hypothetical protein